MYIGCVYVHATLIKYVFTERRYTCLEFEEMCYNCVATCSEEHSVVYAISMKRIYYRGFVFNASHKT